MDIAILRDGLAGSASSRPSYIAKVLASLSAGGYPSAMLGGMNELAVIEGFGA